MLPDSQNAAAAFYRGKTVLVTGGLGFIGSNLARRLLELGAKVRVVDALLTNFGGNRANLEDVQADLRIVVGDMCSTDVLAELLPGCDVIFNLAGHVSHIDSMLDPVTDLEANVRAQIVLLDACRRYVPQVRIAFASTRQIYGRPQYLPVDERHPLRPVDVNGINKMAAEAYHVLYNEVYGLWTVCLRLTNTYGPRMRVKDARQTFLGIWLRKVVEGGSFEVWGGEQKRDLTYVDDVVDAFLRIAALHEAQGKTYNIGGCPPVTLRELAQSLVAIAGSGGFEHREFPAARKRIDIGDYFADDRRFRELTGWEPRIELTDGLGRSVDYYRRCLAAYT